MGTAYICQLRGGAFERKQSSLFLGVCLVSTLVTQDREIGKKIVQKIITGTYWPPGAIEQEIRDYGVPLDIAMQLELATQEKYWKPILKCLLPDKVIPADVFMADLQQWGSEAAISNAREDLLLHKTEEALQTHDKVALCWSGLPFFFRVLCARKCTPGGWEQLPL